MALIKITKRSPFSDKVTTMELEMTPLQYNEYSSGMGRPMQQIFPEFDATTREFLITGMSPEEQEEFFK